MFSETGQWAGSEMLLTSDPAVVSRSSARETRPSKKKAPIDVLGRGLLVI
jgi:hypothetical protein